jgi:hypothetical protein
MITDRLVKCQGSENVSKTDWHQCAWIYNNEEARSPQVDAETKDDHAN